MNFREYQIRIGLEQSIRMLQSYHRNARTSRDTFSRVFWFNEARKAIRNIRQLRSAR